VHDPFLYTLAPGGRTFEFPPHRRERVSLPAEALAKVGEGVRGKQVSSPTLEKGARREFREGKRVCHAGLDPASRRS